MTTWLAGMRITAERLNIDTPTTTTSGLVAGSGFTVNDFRGYRAGNVIALDLFLNRTGADIAASGGNVTPDVTVATVPSGWRPTNGTINGSWDNGSAEGGWVIGTDGICTLRTSSGNIGTNTNLRFHIAFIVD